MRAGLDAAPLELSSGGLRRYVEELHRALEAGFPEDEFALIPRGRGQWWSLGLPLHLARTGADVFHGCNFEVPYLPLRPSVLTLHDLSLWLDPAWHPGPNRNRRRTPVLLGLGLPEIVITPTEAVRRQAVERFRLHPSRVVAVPEGTRLRPARPAPCAPYILFVGTVEPRKNLPFLLEVWRELRRRKPADLVIAGRTRPGAAALEPEPGLRLLGEVPDEELPGLYSGAEAVCYPSLYEGFGLPVLEAMACGAAVITSTDPSIVEVSGDGALHLDARDPKAWLEALLSPPDLRDRALRRASGFTWERTARLTREVYAEAIRRF
jgi:glycosyltransferase involved in cell wall biosynthesis